MPDTAYNRSMSTVEQPRKPLVWLHGEIKTPPFSQSGRLEVAMRLGELEDGDTVANKRTEERE